MKPLAEFSPDSRNRDGRQSRCKSCVNKTQRQCYDSQARRRRRNPERELETGRQWASANRDRKSDAQRRYVAANPEKVSDTQHRHRDANREERNERNRQWLLENPDYHAQYRSSYPEKVAAANRRWREENPDRVAGLSARRRAVLSRCEAEAVDLKAILWRDQSVCYLCGLTVKPQKVHKELHIEHKTPLDRGGPHTPENVAVSHQWCNNSKGTKTEAEYREWLLTHKSIVERHRAAGRDVGQVPTPERWERLKRELEGEPILVLVA